METFWEYPAYLPTQRNSQHRQRDDPGCGESRGSMIGALRIDNHRGINETPAIDDDFAIELDGAIAHRHIDMAARLALRTRPGREEEAAGEAAHRGLEVLHAVFVAHDVIPARLRIEAPPEV